MLALSDEKTDAVTAWKNSQGGIVESKRKIAIEIFRVPEKGMLVAEFQILCLVNDHLAYLPVFVSDGQSRETHLFL